MHGAARNRHAPWGDGTARDMIGLWGSINSMYMQRNLNPVHVAQPHPMYYTDPAVLLRRARREVAVIGSRYPPRSYHTPWCVACWSTQRHHGPHDSWSLPSAVRLHPLSLDSIGRSVLVNSIPRQSTSQPRHLITLSPTVSRARFIQDASQGEENQGRGGSRLPR